MNISESTVHVHHNQGQPSREQLEQQRMLAMRSWEMRPARRTIHPLYRYRRGVDSRTFAQHMLGTLLILGALMLISQA